MPKRGDGTSYAYGVGDWVVEARVAIANAKDQLTRAETALDAIDHLRKQPTTFERMARNEIERMP